MSRDFNAISDLISIARLVQELNFQFERKYELSLAQWLLLSPLKDRPGCSALQLSDAMAVHPSSLTPALKRMKRKGLIEISADPKDSRRKNLMATRSGLKKVETLKPVVKKLLKSVNTGSMKKLFQILDQKRQVGL